MWEIPGVIRSKTCLKPMVGPDEWKLISLYRHYKNGFLPSTGGVLDQPQVFLEAMEAIETQIEKNQREAAERASRRQKVSNIARRGKL